MSKRAFTRTLLLDLTPFAFAFISSVFASEYRTKHLFIVIIDGLRNDEAFEDPTHQYIPRIWNDLRPQGAIYTELYSTSLTYTTSGHATIISGTRNNFPNADTVTCEPFRPRAPTIFEYYRKHSGESQQKAWSITGKVFLNSIDYSLHPEYGADYAAIKMYDTGDDTTTMDFLFNVLDAFHPSLVLLNLQDVDSWGHTGNWEKYTRAISLADSLVWELSMRLMEDPFYSGHTALFVTADHGRHDDLHGGFSHHGGTDHGSQHIFFLAVGPDIKPDTVITHRKDLTDIAPTVGELLGFETPYTEGTILSEMIIPSMKRGDIEQGGNGEERGTGTSDRVTLTTSMSTSPSLAHTNNAIHLVWTEVDSQSLPGKKRMMYARKDLISGDWNNPVPLFADIDNQCILTEGTVTRSGGNDLAVTARAVFELYGPFGEPSYQWYPVVTTSQGGIGWSETLVLDDFAQGSREIIPCAPGVTASDGEIMISWITGSRRVSLKKSTDGGESFSTVIDYTPPAQFREFYFHNPALSRDGSELSALVEFDPHHASRILLGNFHSVLGGMSSLGFLDEGLRPSFSPKVVTSMSRIHYVWSEYAGAGWHVYYRSSSRDGSGLSGIIDISAGSIAAQNPCVAERNDSLVVVWEDYQGGYPDLHARGSPDGGVHWYNPTNLTESPGSSICPTMTLWYDQLALAWQENGDGNWEIYYQEIPLSTLISP